MEKEKTHASHTEHQDANTKVDHTMHNVKEKMEEGREKVEETKEKFKNFGNKHPFPFLGQLESFGVEYLVTKAPFQLPVGLKDFMVKIAPYLVIVMIILLVPLVLALIGLGGYFGGWGSMNYYYAGRTMFYVTSIISAIVLIIEALAITGLFARRKQGWNLLFYAKLISVVSTIISGDIVSAILSLVIGMYMLFQIRSYYTK